MPAATRADDGDERGQLLVNDLAAAVLRATHPSRFLHADETHGPWNWSRCQYGSHLMLTRRVGAVRAGLVAVVAAVSLAGCPFGDPSTPNRIGVTRVGGVVSAISCPGTEIFSLTLAHLRSVQDFGEDVFRVQARPGEDRRRIVPIARSVVGYSVQIARLPLRGWTEDPRLPTPATRTVKGC